jgi:hypothetical protein
MSAGERTGTIAGAFDRAGIVSRPWLNRDGWPAFVGLFPPPRRPPEHTPHSGSQRGSAGLLEVLDTVSTGIEGKRLLWLTLSAAAVPGPSAADYERLVQRAEEQRRRVETLRLDAAKLALAATP